MPRRALSRCLASWAPAVSGIVAELRAATDSPAEVEIELGVKLSSDGSVTIVRAGGEATLRIALRWPR
jgi:hypothetical protein